MKIKAGIKKITAAVITLSMLLGLNMSSVFYAEDAEDDPNIVVTAGSFNAEGEIEVIVALDKNPAPGFATMLLSFSYDPDIFAVPTKSAANGDEDDDIRIDGSVNLDPNPSLYPPGTCVYSRASQSNTTRDGKLFTITLKLKPDAPLGGTTDFTVAYKENGIVYLDTANNGEPHPVDFTIKNAVAVPLPPDPDDTPTPTITPT
ncbi:MAG: hypothetical protein LBT44_01545, partial [Clostridiales bacterium]|nr:hypothetical protein [Clostridiales bacterium]